MMLPNVSLAGPKGWYNFSNSKILRDLHTLDLSICKHIHVYFTTFDTFELMTNLDPDFEKGVESFYYVRVLENPSCRWTAWDAVNNQRKPRTDLNLITQDRAWSSPIWYIPAVNEYSVIPLGGTVAID